MRIPRKFIFKTRKICLTTKKKKSRGIRRGKRFRDFLGSFHGHVSDAPKNNNSPSFVLSKSVIDSKQESTSDNENSQGEILFITRHWALELFCVFFFNTGCATINTK